MGKVFCKYATPNHVPDRMTIYADSSEQIPYKFSGIESKFDYIVQKIGLETGDYVVDPGGLESSQDCAVLERKSLADFCRSATHGRERLEKVFERMTEFGFAAVVIESDWPGILDPNRYVSHVTQVSGKSLYASILAWMQRYGVHFILAPSREFAERTAFRILERWQYDYTKEIASGPHGRNSTKLPRSLFARPNR